MGGSCVRSCVIVPRCGHGLQDPFHKTPRPYPRTYPRSWRGAIQSCDVAHSSSAELTQRSGSLTRLASDLWSGVPKVRMYRTLYKRLTTDVERSMASHFWGLTRRSGSLTRLVSDLWSGVPKVRMYHTLISGLQHMPPRMKNQRGSMRKKT